MMMEADACPRQGWALKNVATGQICLAEICDDEDSARMLLKAQCIHQAHRGRHVAVRVLVKVESA
jgi:hypothetical protein